MARSARGVALDTSGPARLPGRHAKLVFATVLLLAITASAAVVYVGAAYEKDGMLIIPVAIVAGGGGGGTARIRRGNPAAGPGSPPEEDATAHDSTPQDSGRTEAGGGVGGLVLPSGVYVVKGDQVRWVPAVDATIAVLASLSLMRMLVRTWTCQRRHRRRS